MEQWKDIKDYEGLYQVSNQGNVKSLKWGKERILKPGTMPTGYNNVILCKDAKKKQFLVHQLVAGAFLGHVINGHDLVIDHISNIKTQNNVENLQILTSRENHQKRSLDSNRNLPLGVTVTKGRNKKYLAQIWIGKVQKKIGRFYTAEEAAQAYQQQLNKL
jgi:hypothetical protein